MGKNKARRGSGLGRLVIKDRFKGRQKAAESFLHTSEISDGYEWGRLNLKSVTDQNQLDDFLATAELAGTEFTAEKLNVKLVGEGTKSTVPSASELAVIKQKQELHKGLLRIPRRPAWNASTTAEQLDQMERASFLIWRRELSQLQEIENLLITPYERNLEFWRQLWRVIEKSDIVVQIVDGRNPLLFHCKDLEKYVTEINQHKRTVVLVNKSDLLTEKQRQYWADYFTGEGIKVLFWSALKEQQRIDAAASATNKSADSEDDDDGRTGSSSDASDVDDDGSVGSDAEVGTSGDSDDGSIKDDEECMEDGAKGRQLAADTGTAGSMDVDASGFGSSVGQSDAAAGSTLKHPAVDGVSHGGQAAGVGNAAMAIDNDTKLLSSDELLDSLRTLAPSELAHPGILTVGLVGYPNVGKSLTINAILQAKKVSVSATPGKTKHFQTLYVDPTLLLCDCPGLVMPSFVSTKSEMIVNGILPIDQMRDHRAPVDLVCHRIPRRTLEVLYGICIPKPGEGEDPTRPPTSEELLNAYGYVRGYMTANGLPDCSRTARVILKDFVNGKLLYCHPPPGVSEVEFESTPSLVWKHDQLVDTTIVTQGLQKPCTSRIDSDFFKTVESSAHAKGVARHAVPAGKLQLGGTEVKQGSEIAVSSKPSKKHGNYNKKEKARRLFSHHDQHSAF